MKKLLLAASIIGFTASLAMPFVAGQDSSDSDISVSVDRKCEATPYEFNFRSGEFSQNDVPVIGTGGSGYFMYRPTNLGEMSYIEENISIYEVNASTAETIRNMNVSSSPQPNPFNDSYTLNSTNLGADPETSRLREEGDRAVNMTYWYDANYTGWPEYPERLKTREFIASTNYTAGYYRGELDFNYTCEFEASNDSSVLNASSGNSFELGELDDSVNGSEASNLSVEGVNASLIDPEEGYVRSMEKNEFRETYFRVVDVEGNGSTPTNISGEKEIGTDLETDADEVSNFTKNASLDEDVNDTTNSSTNVDTDRDESVSDAEPAEGDSDAPGETPEPEPEPDPVPLLSVDIKPWNSTYTTPRGRFTEVDLEVTNTGEESLNDLELEPRFSEGMDWEAQSATIDSLETNESVNESVFLNPGESVEPRIYQIPVYASNPENDIGSQYVNVEVTEDIFTSALNIDEAPQDIKFETGQNDTVPVLLENMGEDPIENAQIELQNAENCGSYNSSRTNISAGETASVNLNFQASEDLKNCEATIVASTDSGEFSFSEMNIENVEEKGVVPQEFRLPVVASMWTVMLLAYAVLTKRYGMHNLTVKVPLMLLVVGEAFILIYLSSVYYNVVPPGLLPF